MKVFAAVGLTLVAVLGSGCAAVEPTQASSNGFEATEASSAKPTPRNPKFVRQSYR